MSDVALRFGAKDDGLNAQFSKVNKSLEALQGGVSRASAAISGSFGLIGAAVAAIGFGKLIGDAVQFADELQKASDRTGIAAEGLQRLQFAAGQAGVDVGTVTNAISRMQNQLTLVGEGSKEAGAALARLHIPVNDFISLKPDEQFNRVAVSIAQMESPAERTAAAIGLFGKSGAELLPVLVATGKELDKVQAQFDAIGGPVSATAIAQVDAIGDSFAALKLSVVSLSTELLALVGPEIIGGLEGMAHTVAGLRIILVGGNDALVNLDQQIRDTRTSIDRFTTSQKILGNFFGDEDIQIVGLNARLEQLKGRWDALTSVGPLIKLSFDQATVAMSAAAAKSLAAIPHDFGALTLAERRDKTVSGDSPILLKTLEENDLLLKVNADKNAALLKQEADAAQARVRIASDGAEFLAQVRKTFGLQEIKFEEIKNQSFIDIAGGLFGALARENSKLAKIQQGIALAQAIWSTAAGITKALELPYPASIIAAAKVALVGGIQVAKIKATNYNAGSVSSSSAPSFSGGGGGTAAQPVISAPPPASAQRGVAQIIINGPITGEQSMRWLVDRLRESIGDFDLVLTRTG